jgi:hypothetical protein
MLVVEVEEDRLFLTFVVVAEAAVLPQATVALGQIRMAVEAEQPLQTLVLAAAAVVKVLTIVEMVEQVAQVS